MGSIVCMSDAQINDPTLDKEIEIKENKQKEREK